MASTTIRGQICRRGVLRSFATGGGDDDQDKGDKKDSPNEAANDADLDPFGVNFQDSNMSSEGSVNIGPKDSLPPRYIRDPATSKFTERVEKELSDDVTKILNMSSLTKERRLNETFHKALETKEGEDATSTLLNENLSHVAHRIRNEEAATNTLGRRVADVIESGSTNSSSAPLSNRELASMKEFMEKSTADSEGTVPQSTQDLLEEVEDLIPIASQISDKPSAEYEVDPDNPDMDLTWMTPSAQRTMKDLYGDGHDDPFADLMPQDITPATKVCRKKAKAIPRELLHHNNVLFLRRYVTPGGQIMNRVQSRLGAKDQRKVAKLIKRARHLGLIPVLGQWKVEDHGNIKEKDIYEEREWEQELIDRGLVERKSLKTSTGEVNVDNRSMW